MLLLCQHVLYNLGSIHKLPLENWRLESLPSLTSVLGIHVNYCVVDFLVPFVRSILVCMATCIRILAHLVSPVRVAPILLFQFESPSSSTSTDPRLRSFVLAPSLSWPSFGKDPDRTPRPREFVILITRSCWSWPWFLSPTLAASVVLSSLGWCRGSVERRHVRI
jgi:hypothetical protein